jgi:hypothetical protein
VLERLEEGRIETLVIGEQAGLSGGSCPTCGHLYGAVGEYRLDGASLVPVDAGEHLVAQAARLSIPVVIAHVESDALQAHGGVAAILRW